MNGRQMALPSRAVIKQESGESARPITIQDTSSVNIQLCLSEAMLNHERIQRCYSSVFESNALESCQRHENYKLITEASLNHQKLLLRMLEQSSEEAARQQKTISKLKERLQGIDQAAEEAYKAKESMQHESDKAACPSRRQRQLSARAPSSWTPRLSDRSNDNMMADVSTTVSFTCEGNCGYHGSFEQVAQHEETCPMMAMGGPMIDDTPKLRSERSKAAAAHHRAMELAQAVSEQAEQNKEERASHARAMRASNFFLGW